MRLLEVEGLTKKYPKFTLKNVSFSLEQGRIMGLIGKNGAGKSTTLKSMLNMVYPDKGCIKMLGHDFRQDEESCKQNVGVVLGSIQFYQDKKLQTITGVTKRFYQNWDDAAYRKYMSITRRAKTGKAAFRRHEGEIFNCPCAFARRQTAYF